MMIPVCRLDDVPRGDSVRLEFDPPVAVFHTEDGEVYAIDDTCTHQDASLADGWVEGCWVECPLHASKFNLRTGGVDAPPARRPVRTHQVLVEDGMVYLELSDAMPNLPAACPAARLASGAV
ncbi:bifunctional 3-phenylpropionate/cinnamic acid dioxygenase ferredoxin subunit [Streptomyces sp. NPDC021098]|uniref:bifunctional 3-phenylpropionate/cinnamic acid dioxygenase ferredoxin subunit n=1 Tax=unclassified Streptomyces TaxID=2593676 RepID=UPI0037BAB24F